MAFIVGIAGGSGAGKTTLVQLLVRLLGVNAVSTIAFDAYYRDLSHLTMQERAQVNYDHPDSLDHDLFVEQLHELRGGHRVAVPSYDFASHTRNPERLCVEPRAVVVLDGILLLHFPAIRELLDLAVFLDVVEAVRLQRRIKRDVALRGRNEANVRRQFWDTVAPMHDQYVQPCRIFADRLVTNEERLVDVASDLAALLRGVSVTR